MSLVDNLIGKSSVDGSGLGGFQSWCWSMAANVN